MIFSYKVSVRQPHPVNRVQTFYIVANSKASAKRQALEMAGYDAPWPTHRVSSIKELDTIQTPTRHHGVPDILIGDIGK